MITQSQILDTLRRKMEPGRRYRTDELYNIVLWSAYLTAEDWYSNLEDLQGRPNWRCAVRDTLECGTLPDWLKKTSGDAYKRVEA
ncbi:MAG: hypothetical protein OYM47_19985 [Gemmatimonadota bacterium]|nr:hypothetical protein [Gemmatimonadota bacterium]